MLRELLAVEDRGYGPSGRLRLHFGRIEKGVVQQSEVADEAFSGWSAAALGRRNDVRSSRSSSGSSSIRFESKERGKLKK